MKTSVSLTIDVSEEDAKAFAYEATDDIHTAGSKRAEIKFELEAVANRAIAERIHSARSKYAEAQQAYWASQVVAKTEG